MINCIGYVWKILYIIDTGKPLINSVVYGSWFFLIVSKCKFNFTSHLINGWNWMHWIHKEYDKTHKPATAINNTINIGSGLQGESKTWPLT